MNMVIGFGSTEQAFEEAEEKAIREYIADRYAEGGVPYFSDEFIGEVRAWLDERAKTYRARSAEYKAATDFPDRYSDYWPAIVADASHIVLILRFHHINRRHAYSPDGWALMRTERLALVNGLDLRLASEAA